MAATHDQIASLPDLERLCESCRGKGRWSNDPGDWCLRCNGAGFEPTPFGERVLALMRHNFRPLHDALEDGEL